MRREPRARARRLAAEAGHPSSRHGHLKTHGAVAGLPFRFDPHHGRGLDDAEDLPGAERTSSSFSAPASRSSPGEHRPGPARRDGTRPGLRNVRLHGTFSPFAARRRDPPFLLARVPETVRVGGEPFVKPSLLREASPRHRQRTAARQAAPNRGTPVSPPSCEESVFASELVWRSSPRWFARPRATPGAGRRVWRAATGAGSRWSIKRRSKRTPR